ncbi:MAG TPA: hypothetical protein VLF94_07230 [Chlamydiales bacterium]|nr:hypothetical protein [Chlamydiales bacterium]
MSTYISSKMKVPVYVGMISTWPSETTLHTFKVANPRGFETPDAFTAKRVVIRYRLGSLLQDVSEIDEIAVEDAHINIEILDPAGKTNNWGAIGGRMPNRKRKSEVVVRRLTIDNLTAEIQGKGAIVLGIAGTKHFDHMEFDHIDGQEGFPTKEVARQIFESAGMAEYLEKFLNPTERIQESINPFNLFGSK